MTPEERALKLLLGDDWVNSSIPNIWMPTHARASELVAQAIREAEHDTYEEAARIAESHTANEYPDKGLPSEIAADIRALKEPLVETVSS